MRRVFEKLRGLYQRKVMKRFAWLRFFLVMLALGSVLAVMLHQALTAVDTRSAQRAMNESFEFVKAQLVRYNSYVSADKVVALASPDSSPIKRLVQEAKDKGALIDCTYGKKTKTVIVTVSDHVILSSRTSEYILGKIEAEENE